MRDQQATELSRPRLGASDDAALFVATRFPSNFFCIQSVGGGEKVVHFGG